MITLSKKLLQAGKGFAPFYEFSMRQPKINEGIPFKLIPLLMAIFS